MDPMTCARCNQPIQYVGTKKFHEGTRWGVFGELGELFTNRKKTKRKSEVVIMITPQILKD